MFLESVNIPLISDAVTRQALVQTIANGLHNFNYNGIRLQCPISGVFEEFAVFLGEGDITFLSWLTQWYDSGSKFVYQTKGTGTNEVLGICANILASSAPDWLPVMIPITAVGGGFTSRIMFIVEERKGAIIEDPNEISIDVKLRDSITHDLECIKALVGEYTFTTQALSKYKNWYRTQEEGIQRGKLPIADPRFSGYISRRATHIKKIAMASSASRGDDLLITDFDFDRAMQMMLIAEETMPRVFTSVGRSAFSTQTDAVLQFVRERGESSRSEVMRLMYYDIDIRTLEIVEENLVAMQMITRESNTQTGDVTYKWRGGPLVKRAQSTPPDFPDVDEVPEEDLYEEEEDLEEGENQEEDDDEEWDDV
jgi:hypothetical protein